MVKASLAATLGKGIVGLALLEAILYFAFRNNRASVMIAAAVIWVIAAFGGYFVMRRPTKES